MSLKRVLIKISGEYLREKGENSPFSLEIAQEISKNVQSLLRSGVQVAVVIGGGNIVRGSAISHSVERCAADQMGMLATMMNGIFLHSIFQKSGINSCIYGSTPVPGICDSFSHQKAMAHLEKDFVVICAGGSGNPYFTTDTAAVLRALELKCDAVLKATKVDGVYDDDPLKNKNAKRYSEISYQDVLEKKLKVMDLASISLASDNNLPVIVFSLLEADCFKKALEDGSKKTVIS